MSLTVSRRAAAICAVSMFLVSPFLRSQAFTFGPVQKIPIAGSDTYIVTPLDMNGDGDTDLYISGGEGNFIYLGNGKGSFSSTPVKAVQTGVGSLQASPVFYDVNGDGFGDEVYAYAGVNDPNGSDSYPGVFAALLGDGKGNFSQTTYYTLDEESGGGTLVAGDFNHDGKVDFAHAYGDYLGEGGSIVVFLNKGEGKFLESSPIALSGLPAGLTVGDFNGDGNLDLAWSDRLPEAGTKNQFGIHCLLGNGDGTFHPDSVCYTLDGQPWALESADFNRDGKADLVVSTGPELTSSGTPVTGANPRLVTLISKGEGFYWSSSVSWSNIATDSLQIMDLNDDGKPDVVVNGSYLFENGGDGVFNAPQTIATGAQNTFVSLTHDGPLPALFYLNGEDIDYRLNTSPK